MAVPDKGAINNIIFNCNFEYSRYEKNNSTVDTRYSEPRFSEDSRYSEFFLGDQFFIK